jgi:capsular exopolysaccharide synthesis family protein
MLIAVVQISKQESVYRASTSILLTRGTTPMGQIRDADRQVFGEFIDTQVRIINSQAVLSRARESLNIPESEINRLLKGFTVWPIGRSSVISITVTSLDPQFSADFANAVARAYMEFKSDEQTAGSQNTIVNLTQTANKIREDLRKAEEALILFKRENSDITIQEDGNVAASIMSEISSRVATFKMERMVLELQKPLLSEANDDVILTALSSRYSPAMPVTAMPGAQGGSAGDAGSSDMVMRSSTSPLGVVNFDGSTDTTWLDLKKKRSTLELDLKRARENLRDNHPSIRTLIRDLDKVNAELNREVQFATEKYFAELEALTLKENSLSRVAAMWIDEAMNAEVVLDRFKSLQNDVNLLKSLLDAVFSRIRQVDISSGIIPDTITVIEEAIRRDAPVTPRKIQSIFLAGLIGIAVGIAIIFGIDFLDDSIRYPEEITNSLGLHFLGVIPSANWSAGDIRTHLLSQIDPKSGLAEAYRNVRASILVADQNRKSKTLLITSSVPREGKTTTSLNVAISLAMAGFRVLLVDADMRRGELHKYFGLEGGRGLSDVLNGQAKTESVIQRTGVQNLDLVATGPFPANPAELIMRNEFRSFMESAKRSYDKIVFDGPPVMAVSEAAVLASLVESTIMVVWAGKTSRKLCQITIQNLQQRGARVDGCILNNLEFGRVGYYYYSTYYSYYNYDYRYDEKPMGS